MEPDLREPAGLGSQTLGTDEEACRQAWVCVREIASATGQGQRAVWAALTYFHLFHRQVPLGTFPPALFAATCLFVSAKLSDRPLSVRLLVTAYFTVMYPHHPPPLEPGSPVMRKLHEAVVIQEQHLIRSLHFQLTVPTPYGFLLNYAKTFSFPAPAVKVAWAVLNDSLSSHICIKYPVHVLAAAALSAAERLLGSAQHAGSSIVLQQLQLKWYNICDVTDRQMQDCIADFLLMYK